MQNLFAESAFKGETRVLNLFEKFFSLDVFRINRNKSIRIKYLIDLL